MSTGAMPFREAVRLAVEALRAHKLRSFLTLLGVVFGVMTVVAVAAVIEGMNIYVAQTMEDEFGANTIILDRYGIVLGLDEWLRVQKNKIITLDDYRDLRERANLAQEMGIRLDQSIPYLRQGGTELTNVSVIGYSPTIPAMGAGNISVEDGRFIVESDDENRANVVFVGYKIREKLFGGANPVGREIRILGEPFRIIGVSKELGSFLGNDRDTFIVVPPSVHLRMFGPRQSLAIVLQPKPGVTLEALEDQVRGIMRARHHLRPEQRDDFAFIGADALKDLWRNLTGMIAVVALGVVSISLVVGGIVIMNIMMVAVTERTREIGIRKSLGARRWDILSQFLVESSLLSGTGGVLGLAIAWVGLVIAGQFGLPFAMPIWAVVLALVVSTGVGLIFGIYPAYRAANLDPIVALRNE
ncbi:MAG: ABC transporter permease [Chloracidobacterium sp.]|uniref:ABC transporter permease n=1 Tax=Chloracidobacterium validum TaxID=2821543 RepID=A0ABX8B684_9BACT|nr:ABC transporter permease [Chloracidobacterium validum]QUW02486.1 ABC transporter permease [Chloracidobacterium validum]